MGFERIILAEIPNHPFFDMRKIFLPLLPVFLLAFVPAQAGAFESKSAIKVFCSSRIRSLLPDPSSYRFDGFAVMDDRGGGYGTAYVKYAAKNRFGGMQFYGAKCTAYKKNGQRWWKVELLRE
jgi:hypothetical protein